MEQADFQEFHWLFDIIQSTDIGIVVLDKDFTVNIFNQFMQVHSGISPEEVIDQSIFQKFPYLENEWFSRRINMVFELGVPVYSTWEQRVNVFDFFLRLPIHHDIKRMYQNTTFVPLRAADSKVDKVAILVYDVTDSAVNKLKLEDARDELLKLSRIDKLTALLNRGYWEERLAEEFKRYQRSPTNTCLVMFDIDHFKSVNDNYGHGVGDDAIRAVSRMLLANSRDVDICGRYGGEEFAVILPGTDVTSACYFCERLRRLVFKYELPPYHVKFTISLGIAELTPQTQSYEEWVSNADKALYRSKESGRNQTHVFGENESVSVQRSA